MLQSCNRYGLDQDTRKRNGRVFGRDPGRRFHSLLSLTPVIFINIAAFARIIRDRVRLFGAVLFTGARLVLESHAELGMREETMLILSVLGANFGVAIPASRLLSSMNLEVVSTFPTFSGNIY